MAQSFYKGANQLQPQNDNKQSCSDVIPFDFRRIGQLKIGVDMLPLKTNSLRRGIGRYTCNLFRELIKIDSSNQYYFYNVPKELFSPFQRSNTLVSDKKPNIEWTRDLDFYVVTSLMELGIEYDVLPSIAHCPTALIFYDLIPAIFWDKYVDPLTDRDRIEYFKRLSIVKDFDIIFAISQTTKRDLVELLEVPEKKIKVIYGGLDKNFLAPKSNERQMSRIKKKHGIKNKFVLSTAGMDFRKNIEGIFHAFSSIESKLDLVIVCKLSPEDAKRLTKIWEYLRIPRSQLILTNYIPDEDLIALSDAAEVFIFPSLYEGFGLPVLEAMSRGCPVVTSRISSLPEICESAALYVNPYNPKDIAQTIDRIVRDDHLRNKLIKMGQEQYRKFSWRRVAQEFMDNLKAADGLERMGELPRYRIAYFTPLNPSNSGISDYSEELLPHLSKYLDVDLFIDSKCTPSNPAIKGAFNIYPHENFENMNKKINYDLCLYQMGNSYFHEYMLKYILENPGIMVLHDATLTGLFNNTYRGRSDGLLDQIFENHGYSKYLDAKSKLDANINIDQFDYSINFTKKLLDKSILTLVHNDYSRMLLENQSSFSTIWKIDQLGMFEESPSEESPSEESLHEEKRKIRAELGLTDGIQISAFGRIHRYKRIDVLLKAFSMLLNTGLKDVQLFLVGELFDDVQEQILKLIRDLHLTEAVTITGYVSRQDFIKYLKATDICLNLRYPTAGETSATLIKALSMGLPVITTNYAQYKEYPDNCCWKADLGDLEVELLAEYLFVLATREDVRRKMSINAIKYSRENNNIERTVWQYLKAIDYGIKRKKLVTASI